MLQPSEPTKILLAKTRAKAKMYEYSVPLKDHFDIGTARLSDLLDLTIAMLGDLTAGANIEDADNEKFKLFFSAQYFDALIQSKTITADQAYLKLLAATAYYLCGYPGSSTVIVSSIDIDTENRLMVFEKILLGILKRKSFSFMEVSNFLFSLEVENLRTAWDAYLANGSDQAPLLTSVDNLKKKVYADGSDRELLLIDVIRASILCRIRTSTWTLLPRYSGLGLDEWEPYLLQDGSLQDLWPAQVLLAEQGIFGGLSAVIQMPTSAGKTRSSELVIRSSFLANRSSLVIIVAPFRALCQEIYNDLVKRFLLDRDVDVDLVSDVLQEDLEIWEGLRKGILILTPEKFDFILRHDQNFAARVGLVIYDEGHLFDDGTRGIKYELLLSSLKRQLPEHVQIILISAVITNAQQVKEWLIGDRGVVVEAKNLNPTSRSLAFTSWKTARGKLEFVDEGDTDKNLFFVARLLQSQELNLRDRERTKRFFPKKNNEGIFESGEVAGFLGCRLASEGLTSIFTGQKISASKIAENLIDAYDRGLSLNRPIEHSADSSEATKVIRYIKRLLGEESVQAKASELGILIHHGSIPHGLRLVVEFALQKMIFKTVICTSTLAQGVNLPIRYLIVSSDRQAGERIKVRDFHNLMGRVGRSGKYTEGTVIFADPGIYDQKFITSKKWRWHSTAKLINKDNSEPCKSRLTSLFDEKPSEPRGLEMWEKNQKLVIGEIYLQLLNVLSTTSDIKEMEHLVTEVTENTLGYHQLASEERARLVGLFVEIGSSILLKVPQVEKRSLFAKSTLSLEESESLLGIVADRVVTLENVTEAETIITILWDALYLYCENSVLKKLKPENALEICIAWIHGATYPEIFAKITHFERTMGHRITLDQVIDLCESAFGYRIALLLSSVTELIGLVEAQINTEAIKTQLLRVQKLLKYGLPNLSCARIYEMGFSDRELSIHISSHLGDELKSRSEAVKAIKDNTELQNQILAEYPQYFGYIMERIIAGK